MASPSILNDARVKDVERILTLPVKEAEQFVTALQDAGTSAFTIEHIRAIARDKFADDDTAELLVRILLYLHHFKPLHGWSTDEILQNLRDSLASQESGSLPTFDKYTPLLRTALDSNAYSLAAKTALLTLDRIEQISDIAIITDIRPVFDDGRSEIIGSLILNSLRIHVANADRESLSFALDYDSILELREKCDLAIQKTNSARIFFEDLSGKSAVVVGEQEDIDG